MAKMEECPCNTCGEPTTFLGTRQCNDCHEVEGRLEGYLRRGGAKAIDFAQRAVLKARVDNVDPELSAPKCDACRGFGRDHDGTPCDVCGGSGDEPSGAASRPA